MSTLFRTGILGVLVPALAGFLTSASWAGSGSPDCTPIRYGPGTNEGQLHAYGVGNLGSEITFIMSEPPVPDAVVSLFFSGAAVEVPDPPRGTQLVDTEDPGFVLIPAVGQFNDAAGAVIFRVQIPDDFFLAGTSLFWQGVYSDPRGIAPSRLTNGVEVCRCGQFADLVMKDVRVPSDSVFQGQLLQVGDEVVNEGVLSSMFSDVGRVPVHGLLHHDRRLLPRRAPAVPAGRRLRSPVLRPVPHPQRLRAGNLLRGRHRRLPGHHAGGQQGQQRRRVSDPGDGRGGTHGADLSRQSR